MTEENTADARLIVLAEGHVLPSSVARRARFGAMLGAVSGVLTSGRPASDGRRLERLGAAIGGRRAVAAFTDRRGHPRGAAGRAPDATLIWEYCRAVGVALIVGALLGTIAWRFTDPPRTCQAAKLRSLDMAGRS